MEIKDGYGHWATDTDGDGKLDEYGSENDGIEYGSESKEKKQSDVKTFPIMEKKWASQRSVLTGASLRT